MKNKFIVGVIVLLIIGAGYYAWSSRENKTEEKSMVEEATVRKFAEDFGSKFKNVSLAAEKKMAAQMIEENYKNFVTAELLNKWKENPTMAPGRLTSSPWPERIEVMSVKKISSDEFEVSGDIIEMTSAEVGTGKVSARLPITLKVKSDRDSLIVSDVN